MKAARFIGNNSVEVIHKPIPVIKDNEILIKVEYCGLCGSERAALSHGYDRCVPGHEISGVVDSCGCAAHQYDKGSAVIIYLPDYCGQCSACIDGNTSQCCNRRGLIGWSFDGGYEEYVAVPDHMVVPIGDIPLELGVIALDTIGTAFHGLRQLNIATNSSALVIGCGPIGLGCLSILKNHYAVKALYAADISEFRCKMAQGLGAEAIRVDKMNTLGSIRQHLGTKTIDHVIEVCGLDTTVRASVSIVKPGGNIALIGEPEKALTLERSSDWVLKDFSLINTWYFPLSEVADNLAYISKNQDLLSTIITDYYTIDHMTEAYEKFWAGNTGKVLIRF